MQNKNLIMNTEYRYILASNIVPKLNCPYCEAKKHWQRYIDIKTGEAIPEQYGKCDNDNKCGEWNDPYKDGYAKAIWEQEQGNKTDWKPRRPKLKNKLINKPKRAFIPIEIFNRTRAGYEQNTFIQNLLTRVAFPFEVRDIEKVISLYHLGTVSENGAVCFPFIDIKGNVNAVQEKIFNDLNHTDKTKKYHTSWLHSRLTYSEYRNKHLPQWLEVYNKNETKVSCLFGEHLLSKYLYNPIALVEAPKTAIYGTLYFGFPKQPTNILWLAVYNLSSLNLNKCQALKGRNVYLFPDLSKDGKAFKLWSNRAAEIQKRLQGTYFHVSDLLERLAPQQDKEQGKDIADYLIKQDWRLFRKQGIKETPQPEPELLEISTDEKSEKYETKNESFFLEKIQKEVKVSENQNWFPKPSQEQPKKWDADISELKTFFENITITNKPIKLNQSTIIINCQTFIENHLATVKANNGRETFIPYLNRLKRLKEVLI